MNATANTKTLDATTEQPKTACEVIQKTAAVILAALEPPLKKKNRP